MTSASELHTVNGKPHTARGSVMARAWSIFRERYGYRGRGAGVRFNSIGRPCFAWCLREAWRQVRDEQRRAAVPADVKAARAAAIKVQIADLVWMDNFRQAQATRSVLEAELRQLAA